MRIALTILFAFSLMNFTCEKERNICWQGFSPAGADIRGLLLCDKTKAEAEALYPAYWFYDSEEPRFCWKVITPQGSFYMRQIPVSMVDRMRPNGGYIYTQVDCNSFCQWEWEEKVQHKQNGLYGPTRRSSETYMADSCSKLYEGRVIITRETPDSIYRRTFLAKAR